MSGIERDLEDVLERWQARHNSRVRHLHAEGIDLAGGENQSVNIGGDRDA